MKSKIPFSLWLTCEHCKHKVVLFTDFSQTESKCANGMNCGKMSKLDETEKIEAYINYLEIGFDEYKKSFLAECSKNKALSTKQTHVKTLTGGTRIVYNDFNSIQWSVNQNIKDLK